VKSTMRNSILGSSTIEKHILLLKLTEMMENRPSFGDTRNSDPDSAPLQWISKVRGVVQRIGISEIAKFDAIVRTTIIYWKPAIQSLQTHIYDIIESLKVDLEIDGRAEIGSAYKAGDVYSFFKDLKTIIKSARKEIFLIDPYLNSDAFTDYLAEVDSNISTRVLVKSKPTELATYLEKHIAQFGSKIEMRSSKAIHDRIIFIDGDSCWLMGGSMKDAGKNNPTYLIPLSSEITYDKISIYENIWQAANHYDLH